MNRFEMAMQALEKINPGITGKYLENHSSIDFPPNSQKILGRSSSTDGSFIQSLLPLPLYTIIFGVCEDELPLIFDLAGPSYGSILISGQQSWVISSVLNWILISASIINPQDIVQYAIITSNPEFFSATLQKPHCLNIFDSRSRHADELIMDLSAIVEQRNTGRQRGPTIILAIDDLSLFTRHIDEDIYAHFKWLLREGPFSSVWPIVTCLEMNLSIQELDLVQSFGTRILESTSIPPASHFINRQVPEDYYPQMTFEVQSGRERIPFYLPVG